MIREEAKNAIKFDYFSMYEFINKINLDRSLCEHAVDSEIALIEYIEELRKLPDDIIDLFLSKAFYEEISDSNLIESNLIYPEEILDGDIYLDTFHISHERIKKLHDFIERGTGYYEYRNIDAWIRRLTKEKETIFWYGAKPEDIGKFMDDFIDIYKNDHLFDDNIFLRCSLIHLLFLRIHPFKDGNGRTSRLITDVKFTEIINQLCGLDLRISPLHLSHSIYRNRSSYNEKIDNICFDLEHFSNNDINRWFKFMLDMYDEQLFYMEHLLVKSRNALENASSMNAFKNEVVKKLILK